MWCSGTYIFRLQFSRQEGTYLNPRQTNDALRFLSINWLRKALFWSWFLHFNALYLGRVNGRNSDRVEIRTPSFQLQYLLQLYSKNLTIMLEPFTGTLWMGWCWSWGSTGRIWADIVGRLSQDATRPNSQQQLSRYRIWKLVVRISALSEVPPFRLRWYPTSTSLQQDWSHRRVFALGCEIWQHQRSIGYVMIIGNRNWGEINLPTYPCNQMFKTMQENNKYKKSRTRSIARTTFAADDAVALE